MDSTARKWTVIKAGQENPARPICEIFHKVRSKGHGRVLKANFEPRGLTYCLNLALSALFSPEVIFGVILL